MYLASIIMRCSSCKSDNIGSFKFSFPLRPRLQVRCHPYPTLAQIGSRFCVLNSLSLQIFGTFFYACKFMKNEQLIRLTKTCTLIQFYFCLSQYLTNYVRPIMIFHFNIKWSAIFFARMNRCTLQNVQYLNFYALLKELCQVNQSGMIFTRRCCKVKI